MDIHSSNAQVPARAPAAVASTDPQGFDIVRVLWRWKFLPILGAVIGMALGYLHYTTLPPLYIATALVQVQSPMTTSNRNQAYNAEEVMQVTRQDESLVIGSERVLRLAADKLVDSDRPAIKGRDANFIAAYIAGGRRLSVSPAAKDSNTSLINVNFICDDAQLSPEVVNAIVAAYQDYLSEEYKTIGLEIHKLMTTAQDRVLKEMKALTERTVAAKERIEEPIMWTAEGTAINPHAVDIQQYKSKIAAIDIERNAIMAKLDRAQKAIEMKKDPGSILLLLTDTEHVDLNNSQKLASSTLETTLASQRLESEQMELRELFPLQVQEKQYLSTVGEGHPRLASLRLQIDAVKQKIETVRQSERSRAAEVDQRLSDKRKAEAEQPVFKPITAGERVEIHMNAIAENLAALDNERVGLEEMAKTAERKSKMLANAIQEVEANNTELEMVKNLHEVTIEKLKQLTLGPTAYQRSLKELNRPGEVGYFYGPKIAPYLIGGGAIGFLILAGLAVLLDLADKSFRSPEDIAAEIGAPVLGHIPAMELDKIVKKPQHLADSSLCTIHHSRGRVSEAYRSVRTGLFFSNRTGDLKVIQVTSPVPGDGKSTLSSNLAVTMAQSGRNVLLIDADFRRPRIAKLFNIESDKGMATAVAGACELDEAIHVSSVPGLSVMPGGKRPSNPAELLSSQRFAGLLGALREKFDIVIVDTPPLLAVSDPSAVAAVVDGVVLTMRLRRNVKPLVTRAARVLESVDANLLGIVVNGVSQEAGYGYNYGYRDYRYAYQYRYGYGYKGYGSQNSYYGAKKYLEESHDVDTDHVLMQDQLLANDDDQDQPRQGI